MDLLSSNRNYCDVTSVIDYARIPIVVYYMAMLNFSMHARVVETRKLDRLMK